MSGFTEGLAYWLGQHGEARAAISPGSTTRCSCIYEPLALFAGLGTVIWMIVRWLRGRGDEVIVDDRVDAYAAE